MPKYIKKINRSKKQINKTIQDKYVKLRKLKQDDTNKNKKSQIEILNQKILSYRYT